MSANWELKLTKDGKTVLTITRGRDEAAIELTPKDAERLAAALTVCCMKPEDVIVWRKERLP